MNEVHNLWLLDAAQPVSSLLLTFGAFVLAERIQAAARGAPLLNPVLLSIAMVSGALELTGTDYPTYASQTSFISFLLGPATVALGLPLWRQWAQIRAHGPEIAVALAVGLVGPVSAVGIAALFGATPDVLLSLAPKSVTAAFAMGISAHIGGVPALTAVFTISTGVTGAILGTRLWGFIGVRDWGARGLATGIAAHAIATASLLRQNEMAGAMASLALSLNGLLTAVLLPAVVAALHLPH